MLTDRQREREAKRGRQTEKEREADRQRKRERQTDRQTDKERERERGRKTERQTGECENGLEVAKYLTCRNLSL